MVHPVVLSCNSIVILLHALSHTSRFITHEPMKELTRKPNRLARETSPYLLQHANNPVSWYPWGSDALKRALDEDKIILLSIGYSACPPGTDPASWRLAAGR
jgi:hypothetical protein